MQQIKKKESFKQWYNRKLGNCEAVAEYFFNEISAHAEQIGVNWDIVSDRILWNYDVCKISVSGSSLLKGVKDSVGIYASKKHTPDGIEYPLITFKNKGGNGETIVFNGKPLIWDEYFIDTGRYKYSCGNNSPKKVVDKSVIEEKRNKAIIVLNEEMRRKRASVDKDLTKFKFMHSVSPDFPYIVEKKIADVLPFCNIKEGSNFRGEFIALCLYTLNNGSLPKPRQCGLQKIFKKVNPIYKTNKYFTWGMEKKGAFGVVGQFNYAEYIFICEGFATASSIFLSLMDTNIPVCCLIALDAGNLNNVVKDFKTAENRNKKFILVADNDGATKKPKNTGLAYAKEVCTEYSIPVVYPEFSKYLLDTGASDFNDLHCKSGLSAVKDRISFCLNNQKTVWQELNKH
jgi:hypothetical protein